MDRERLLKVHEARSAQIEAMNGDLPEAQKGQVEELKERFRAVAERMAKYVEHNHYPPEFSESNRQEQKSGARHIGTFEGPMPDVYVSFEYVYRHPDFDIYADLGGIGFNEHNENITSLIVHFSHYPNGITAGPSKGHNYLPKNMEYGEIFASEGVSFHDLQMLERENWDTEAAERFWGQHPSVNLTLIEQAMDQYEAAPPSPYEIREGLVTV